MGTNAFDAIARQAAAGVSRRASVQILGGVPLAAALLGPTIVAAKKSGRNEKKKAKEKAQQKAQQQCLAQAGQCREFFAGRCESPDPSECEAMIAPCCEVLGRCDAASFLSCLFEAN